MDVSILEAQRNLGGRVTVRHQRAVNVVSIFDSFPPAQRIHHLEPAVGTRAEPREGCRTIRSREIGNEISRAVAEFRRETDDISDSGELADPVVFECSKATDRAGDSRSL